MQYISKAFLKLLSLLIVVVQLFLLLGSIAVVIASGAMFFVNGEAKYELYKYVLGPNNITIPMLLFSCLVALIIVISLILILHSLRKIINNIYSEDYFVESNL
ncbi:MAG TPA: hypothetical protein VK109_03085, partial [Enterococcus sp.]|nr:hypothetical protein [Enterococcus sp.]